MKYDATTTKNLVQSQNCIWETPLPNPQIEFSGRSKITVNVHSNAWVIHIQRFCSEFEVMFTAFKSGELELSYLLFASLAFSCILLYGRGNRPLK